MAKAETESFNYGYKIAIGASVGVLGVAAALIVTSKCQNKKKDSDVNE